MNNWKPVYKTNNVIDAEMVKAQLLQEGIEAVVLNRQDSSFLFGTVSVFCSDTDYDAAMLHLKNNQNLNNSEHE